ncbi:zinc finger CCCH domain-containing protein 21-like [Brassica napus]|nr:zinc finger CCCH domain-containing protein 21-like [Brassica napus]
MPPKQQPKADLAKKQKQVEDKTFGLKNKNKSKNVQKYVQSLKQSVQPKPDASKVAAKKKKEEEKAREQELNELFKVAISQPKVPVGVDPKSILCEFFKHGQCQKGFKCKFSHDLNIQRKGEKIDIYSDKRDEDGNMEEWDQETLEKVVESKKNEYNQNKPTDIVCKYFLDAVEKKQYGWFWACPNGGKECHYRHALPPGYILKSQMKALLEEESQKMPVEEVIENERAKLKTATQMTPALFMEWKRKKIAERDAGLAASQAERAKNDRMSGRELFLSNASLFVDDAEAFEEYQREKEEEEIEQKAKDKEAEAPGTSKSSGDAEQSSKKVDEEDEDDDDDDLDMDELDELEASLSKTSIQIREPND